VESGERSSAKRQTAPVPLYVGNPWLTRMFVRAGQHEVGGAVARDQTEISEKQREAENDFPAAKTHDRTLGKFQVGAFLSGAE
jgi:hypothetical protein